MGSTSFCNFWMPGRERRRLTKSSERKLSRAKRSERANLIESKVHLQSILFQNSVLGGVMGFEEYCGTHQDYWTCQGDPGERICEDTRDGEYETKGRYEKNEDSRDGNNNSSPALFSEEEIHGRGRGLVAKVNT